MNSWYVSVNANVFKILCSSFQRFTICAVAHSLSWTLATKPLVRHLRPANSSPSAIMDALDLMTNLRGVGWDWSRGLYIPRETRPTNRFGFAFYTLLSVVAHLFLCSVFHQVIKSFVGRTEPLTVFDDTLTFPMRHLRAGIIAVVGALTVHAGTQTTYDIATLVGVLVVRQDPAQWPPAYAQPWRATSLSALWGRRWHQTLRHTLLVCAMPFGRAWAVPAVFVASGLVHQLILLRAYDSRAEAWRMVVGFGMIGPGVLAERAYRRVTGRRVGGVLGWVWTMAWMLVWGSLIVDGFLRAGMYAQPNAIDGESPLWALIESWVVRFDAWLHAV